jgi:nucleotide-binding universal stress UspA family protein
MFDRLLLALDDTPAGEVAALFCAALAGRSGASVHVLHVNERLVGGNGVTLRSRQESVDLVEAAVREFAEGGVRASGSVCVSTYRTVPQRIVATALERSADAIVLGSTRNRHRLGRPRSGSAQPA